MRDRDNIINKLLKSNKKMYMTLYVGMILTNIYIQFCVFENFKTDSSLKELINEKGIYILITFVFMINYIFILSEIIEDHIYDLNILKICGISNIFLSLMLFLSIIKNWINSFVESSVILFFLLKILDQRISCILKVFLVSFLINLILNTIIIGINIYIKIIKKGQIYD